MEKLEIVFVKEGTIEVSVYNEDGDVADMGEVDTEQILVDGINALSDIYRDMGYGENAPVVTGTKITF